MTDPLIIAAAVLAAVTAVAALGAIAVASIRTMRRADTEATEQRMTELDRATGLGLAQIHGRLDAMGAWLQTAQGHSFRTR
jgi:hypothetical protein